MRKVCWFLQHKNLCFGIRWTLGKHFLSPAGCSSVFPAKSCPNAWRSGSRLVRGQVNIVDETKLCSPISSTFEVLVVWHAVGHCHGEELGPFCWPILAGGVAVFWCISLICWAYFSDVIVLLEFRKCSGSDQQQTTKQWLWPFLVQVWLWELLGSFFWSNHRALTAGCHIKFTFCPTSQSNQEMVCCCCTE